MPDGGDHGEVFQRVIRQLLEYRCAHRICIVKQHEGVAIGFRFGDRFVATMPPALGRLSMIICWPIASLIFCMTARDVMSPTPPGPNGTSRRMGLLG